MIQEVGEVLACARDDAFFPFASLATPRKELL